MCVYLRFEKEREGETERDIERQREAGRGGGGGGGGGARIISMILEFSIFNFNRFRHLKNIHCLGNHLVL